MESVHVLLQKVRDTSYLGAECVIPGKIQAYLLYKAHG